jgi:hypothetical protein
MRGTGDKGIEWWAVRGGEGRQVRRERESEKGMEREDG